MSTEKDWKIVNKGKKVVSNGKVPVKKAEKKKIANSMPRMDPILPLKETPTIYQRFMEEELKAELKAERHGRKEEDVRGGAVAARKNLKNLNLRDAIDGLDKEDLDRVVSENQASSPNNPENVLKALATFINSQLPNPPNYDPVLSDKPHNYPLCEASPSVETLLSSYLLHSRSDGVVLDCLDQCIDALVTAVSKEQFSMGYRLIIQLILKRRAHLIVNRLPKYEALQQKHSGRPLRNLIVMWCFSQAGYTSLSNGLKIWFHLMFSQISVKNVNLFVVDFLEKLIKLHPKMPLPPSSSAPLGKEQAMVSKTDYFKFFSEVFSSQNALSETLKERLKKLLPFIKEVAWTEGGEHLSTFFLGYLSRCVRECPHEKKLQLLQGATECLLKEPTSSFEAWRGKLSKYPSQSALLLQHMQEERGQANKALLGREGRWKAPGVVHLLPTLRRLREENTKDEEAMDDVITCIECIERMKQKGKRSKGWLLLLLLLLLTPFFLLAADLHQHGSLHKTHTMKYIKDAGVDVLAAEALARVKVKSALAYQYCYHLHFVWALDSCPEWLKDSFTHLPSPDLESASKWATSLKELTSRGVQELNNKLPFLLEYLVMASEYVINFLLFLYQHLSTFILFLHHHLSIFFHSCLEFLTQKVFVGEWSPDKLQAHVTSMATVVKGNVDHVLLMAKKSLDAYFKNDSK